jgi:uncharacterized membrane protein YhiD involved in acid resistance
MHGLAGRSSPYDEVATKLALSLGIGLLIGLEREWAQKAAGVRSFAITALLGTLTALASIWVVLVPFRSLCLLILLMNAHGFLKRDSLEITTSVTLRVTLTLGSFDRPQSDRNSSLRGTVRTIP